jgi:hypothetical protein
LIKNDLWLCFDDLFCCNAVHVVAQNVIFLEQLSTL